MATKQQIQREASRKRAKREREVRQREEDRNAKRRAKEREMLRIEREKEALAEHNEAIAAQCEEYIAALDTLHQYVNTTNLMDKFHECLHFRPYEPYEAKYVSGANEDTDLTNVTLENLKDANPYFPSENLRVSMIIAAPILLIIGCVLCYVGLYPIMNTFSTLVIIGFLISIPTIIHITSKKKKFLIDYVNECKKDELEHQNNYKLDVAEYNSLENERIELAKSAYSGDEKSRTEYLKSVHPGLFMFQCHQDVINDDINSYDISLYTHEDNVYVGIFPPSSGVVPTHTIKVSGVRKNISMSAISEKNRSELYYRFLCSFILFHCIEIFRKMPFMKTIYLDAYGTYTDPSNGKTLQQIFLSLTFDPACLNEINFANADALAVYENFDYDECELNERSEIEGRVPKEFLAWE